MGQRANAKGTGVRVSAHWIGVQCRETRAIPALVPSSSWLSRRARKCHFGGRKNSKTLGDAEARAGVEGGRVAKVERVGLKDGGG